MSMKIVSWNVNGIRAVAKKGFYDWLHSYKPDVLCLQETKARPEQLEEGLKHPPGYQACWDWPLEKKGYSGTVT
ncbi:MAG: endonuclease/exonuclease/phosphatase family protein, partial [Candidatus Thermoplasmatota archaeon]|nr:endonuclease/exonuclease/phosphatase family protein [Candidatus Thermoplasmatota archaeon]